MIVTNRLIYKFHQVSGFFAGVSSESSVDLLSFEAELKGVSVFGTGLVKNTLTPGNTAPEPLKIKSVSAVN